LSTLLNDDIKKQVMEFFGALQHPVQVILFTSKDNCETCDITRDLLAEVVALSDQLELVEYDLAEQAELARQFKIDRAPGTVITGKENDAMLIDYGIRLLGIPSGSEFTTLINDLVMVSARNSGLTDETRTFLSGLTGPVHLQVFVTPT
jgi:alkyl hydroperoxide reductase subunit AhpF